MLVIAAALAAVTAAGVTSRLPAIAAGGLLHPSRNDVVPDRPGGCEDREFAGEGLTLRGWYCKGQGAPRATLIYLHGIADNRASSVGVIQRFTPRGFDVIAYDSRGHGRSDGEVCTYGYYEKADLRRVIETASVGPVILLGSSLGAAVALQEAGANRRVTAVIAAEPFADLRTVAIERAPFFLTRSTIEKAVRVAEEQGAFTIDDVSPVKAAGSIRVPVLLIHGANDVETVPEHSERVLDALAGPKRLIVVQGAGHNQSLGDGKVWTEIEDWIDAVLRVSAR